MISGTLRHEGARRSRALRAVPPDVHLVPRRGNAGRAPVSRFEVDVTSRYQTRATSVHRAEAPRNRTWGTGGAGCGSPNQVKMLPATTLEMMLTANCWASVLRLRYTGRSGDVAAVITTPGKTPVTEPKNGGRGPQPGW